MSDEMRQKNCPFCDSPKVRWIGNSQHQCQSCGATGPHDDREGWNKRADDALINQLFASLLDYVREDEPGSGRGGHPDFAPKDPNQGYGGGETHAGTGTVGFGHGGMGNPPPKTKRDIAVDLLTQIKKRNNG